MSEVALLWLFGGCYALGCLAVSLAAHHQIFCNKKERERAITEVRIETKLDMLVKVFDVLGASIKHQAEVDLRVTQAERFISELREMKHHKVDPYLPKAFDEFHERLQKLESHK